MDFVKETVEVLNKYFQDFEDGDLVAYVSVGGNGVDVHTATGDFLVTYDPDEAQNELLGQGYIMLYSRVSYDTVERNINYMEAL